MQEGYWIPAQGETPTKYRNGMTLMLYWNPVTHERCHLNVENDMFLTTEEYLKACGM